MGDKKRLKREKAGAGASLPSLFLLLVAVVFSVTPGARIIEEVTAELSAVW